MNLIRNAARSNASLRKVNPTIGVPRCFSTGTEQPPRGPAPPNSSADASVNQFLQTESTGVLYAKLIGGSKYAMKSDIISFLDGCNLTPDDIKFSYSFHFEPAGVRFLRFPSPDAYHAALRTSRRLAGYWLDRIDVAQWNTVVPYDGKTVVLQGIPRNATIDDIERFFSGCDDYEASSLTVFYKGPVRFAVVRYPSHIQAMNAYLKKDRRICLNDKISVRVLY